MTMQSFYDRLSASPAGSGGYFQWLSQLRQASLAQMRQVHSLLRWELWGA